MATRRGKYADLYAERRRRRYRIERMRGGSWRVADDQGRVYGVYADRSDAVEHLGHLRAAQKR